MRVLRSKLTKFSSVFLRILQYFLVSWDINPLQFFSWNFYTFNKRSLSKYKIGGIRCSRKSKMLHFDGSLLSKSCKVLAKKVQRSYLSWHWRMMQSLKKNGLVVLNITWGIWSISTQKSESFYCDGLFLSKVYVQGLSYKNIEELSFMILHSDAKFE